MNSLEERNNSSEKKRILWITPLVVTACFAFGLTILNKYWDPIAAYIGYPFSTGIDLAELAQKVKTLSRKKNDFSSWDPNRSSFEESKGWLSMVGDLQNEEKELSKRYAECSFLSYFPLCHIGKDVERELKKASDLISQGEKFLANVKPHPHTVRDVQPRDQPAPGTFPGMEGPYNKVLSFIKNNLSMSGIMGVWGMGGVGKTTLIERVRNACSDQYAKSFKVVLYVHAGKSGSTVSHLQKVISISMGLAQLDDEKSQEGFIHNHLHDKDFLLLVDDLCQTINLVAVGIPLLQPLEHKYQRKIVFTTRSEEVCTQMNFPDFMATIINMKCLNKKDAWDLFARNVNKSILECAEICQLAEKIVEECNGLPMALCKIGKFMSCKKDSAEWSAAVHELRMPVFHSISRCYEDILKCLQESYDNMRDDREKARFLLCSLWPENENISMKKLTRWWTGLGLLDGFLCPSDKGISLINDLVSKSMLEKGDTGPDSTEYSHVKMHKMIRMMALWIVNEQGYTNKWLPNSSYRSILAQDKWHKVEKAWVSQEDTSRWCRWSSTVRFPRLNMLVGQHLFSLNLMIRYFQKITFLDLEGIRRGGFPLEICKLTNLQHLNLSATRIVVLPLDLNKLVYLKYLYIRNNMYLQTIPEGLILALRSLQGLDLFGTGAIFHNVLKELASSARDLDMLGFTVRTTAEITQLVLLKTVCTQALYMHHIDDGSNPDIINLQILSELRELRELSIVQSFQSQTVLVAEGAGSKYPEQQLLPHLKFFELNNLLKLKTVTWKHAGVGIRVISICKCDGLKDVTWVHHLKSLEQLTIAHCKEMKRLIETGELPQGVNQTAAISFLWLKKLTLEGLPKLSMIAQKPCRFEELSYISVTRCNAIKNIHGQQYKQLIKIHCSEDWWTKSKLAGTSNPYLAPTFSS